MERGREQGGEERGKGGERRAKEKGKKEKEVMGGGGGTADILTILPFLCRRMSIPTC